MEGVFAGLEELLELIEGLGWSTVCLAWRTVTVEAYGNHDLYLFETPPTKSPMYLQVLYARKRRRVEVAD